MYIQNRFILDGSKGENFKVFRGRLPGVISINTHWTTQNTAGTFSIVCENKDGLLSPDYFRFKTDTSQTFRGHWDSSWPGQLMPNTVMEIHWGYGDDVVREMTCDIDNISVDAEAQTITITGRSMFKRAIDNTVTPYKGHAHIIPASNMLMTDALNRLVSYAKLKFHPMDITDPATNEHYTVGEPMGMRGDTYDEVIRKIIDTIPYILREEPDGSIKLMKIPKFTHQTEAVFTIDDTTHMKDLEYELNDTDKFGTLIVKGGDRVGYYDSSYIQKHILRGHRRELPIEAPHANTSWKRKMAAQAHFIRQLHNWRKISVGIPANPALQIWDVVRINERISTAQWNYHITSLDTTFDASGFYQILSLSGNFGYMEELPPPPPPPTGDLPALVVNISKITLKLADYGAPDGDVINVYLNGKKIVVAEMLKEEYTDHDLELKKGVNTIIFEGVSAGQSDDLTALVHVFNGDTPVMKDPMIVNIPRKNVDGDSGYFKGVKPRKSWVVKGVWK